MTIIERNLFRLLRAGAFGQQEPIEPLSAWKWQRLYQLALLHNVEALVYQGIVTCREQFFVQVPEELLSKWNDHVESQEEENQMLTPGVLTNPLLNKRLQAILSEEGTTTETRSLLVQLTGIARFIMNAGVPVKRLAELAIFIRREGSRVDYDQIRLWTSQLKMEGMVQLTANLLVGMMHMKAEELPFATPADMSVCKKMLQGMLKLKNSHATEWYFSQGKSIFVHTSNPSALLWHVKRSARYFHYFPAESMTNFASAFMHSLSHIEE